MLKNHPERIRRHGGCSSSLGLTAALGSHIAATTARSEASTAVTLEISTALTASTVTTTAASTTTSSAIAIAAIGVATGATLLDKDLLAANLVRVGGNSSSVAGGLGKFNESTVLGRESC